MNESRRCAPEASWKPLLGRMVDRLAASGVLRTQAIRRSFLDIPRHLFVAESSLEEIYSDVPIVTKTDAGGQTGQLIVDAESDRRDAGTAPFEPRAAGNGGWCRNRLQRGAPPVTSSALPAAS